MQKLTSCLLVGALFGAAGCSAPHPQAVETRSQTVSVPPKKLLADVSRVVSQPPIALPVENDGEGAIVTGWQPFRGEFHVVRYWHERTRYHIHVIPDWSDPLSRSRIEVVDETQERPDDSGPNEQARTWAADPNLHRPERAAALLTQIQTQLSRSARN